MSDVYVPRRDSRFEYLWDAMSFLEDRQCGSCALREDGEYPMCVEKMSDFIEEEPVRGVVDAGVEGIKCLDYVPAD